MNDRVPLDKQIAALNTLITAAQRGEKFKPAEVRYMMPRWMAAFESLTWLASNERKIKEALRHGAIESDKSG